MAVSAEIKVSVDIDKTVEELYEIGSMIEELRDLIPEWSQMEAETIEDDIFQKLESLIMTRRISRQQLRNQDAEPVFTYEKNGNWYTIYKHGEQVDKFQGKAKLAKYGLDDGNNES